MQKLKNFRLDQRGGMTSNIAITGGFFTLIALGCAQFILSNAESGGMPIVAFIRTEEDLQRVAQSLQKNSGKNNVDYTPTAAIKTIGRTIPLDPCGRPK